MPLARNARAVHFAYKAILTRLVFIQDVVSASAGLTMLLFLYEPQARR